jgi:hypothetical protein
MRHRFLVLAVGLLAAGLLVGGGAGSLVGPPAFAGSDDITGIVQGPRGPEAGVWVIAETNDLDTKFRKIVVTNDAGRFLIPDMPAAAYRLWVRGYGLPMPGALVRLELGNNPPETCKTEIYQPPFDNPAVDPSKWGFGPRGIDVDRNGLIWTALGGSGHLASFDRSKCKVLNGPSATGQHCPEGWTLYSSPGPKFKGVNSSANADFHYYNWVDQFNTLGLGENVPIANGTGSDALLALVPQTREWVIMRVPYPLGFYTRGLDGRIDDPKAGWKVRGVWASYDSFNWHNEGGKGMTSEIVRFQIRPDPLAE